MKLKQIKKALAIFGAIIPLTLCAQTVATSAVTQDTGQSNAIWYIIIGIIVVLLFAILILGNVLVDLAKLTVKKHKALALIVLLITSNALFAQSANAPQQGTGSPLGVSWNIIMASCVLIVELFVVIVLLLRINSMVKGLSEKKEEVTAPRAYHIQLPKFLDNINASVAVEEEKDILLDHNYDGIRELNNNLPPWWKYSFYLSILFAIGYLSYYHVLGGPSSHDEYDASVKKAQEEQEAYAKLHAAQIDENTVTMADAAGIDDGKNIFVTNCVVCHGKAGEGIVGPNLTDNYWLHGGRLKDVFKTIKYGWPAKGMKSWQMDLSPVQIKNVASYIKTLGGTNPPNAKAPQGDYYDPALDKPVQSSSDTAKAKSI